MSIRRQKVAITYNVRAVGERCRLLEKAFTTLKQNLIWKKLNEFNKPRKAAMTDLTC